MRGGVGDEEPITPGMWGFWEWKSVIGALLPRLPASLAPSSSVTSATPLVLPPPPSPLTCALATAITILAPSLAMPPASALRPTMKPAEDIGSLPDRGGGGRHDTGPQHGMRRAAGRPRRMAVVCMSAGRPGAYDCLSSPPIGLTRDVLDEEQGDASLTAQLHKVCTLQRRLTAGKEGAE